MEARLLLATITVTGAGDGIATDGIVTLREAIAAANTNAASGDAPAGDAGLDTIAFDIPGEGVQTIRPPLDLPAITEPVTIDGYTQPGSSPNTNPVTAGSNAVILIELDGSLDRVNDFGRGTGLRISAGGSAVRGLAINRFTAAAINADLGDGNTIAGNVIGLDPAGAVAFEDPAGVRGLIISSSNNTIGGTAPADRNVISGSSGGDFFGVFLGGNSSGFSTGNVIQGNFIGTDATGTLARGLAGSGVTVSSSSGVKIGGTVLAERNLISGNRGAGIKVDGGRDILIQGNLIGTDVTGRNRLGNGEGIFFNAHSPSTIGGTTPGAGNIIAGNRGTGIEDYFTSGHTIQGNFIGTDATATINLGNGVGIHLHGSNNDTIGGTTPAAGNVIAFSTGDGVLVGGLGNSILGNSIFENGSPPSKGINFPSITAIPPVLTSANPASVAGTLNGPANTTFRLELFATPVTGSMATPQGRTFLGTTDVTTDGAGNARFTISPPGGVPVGQFLTATATNPAGSTSEFSAAITIQAASSTDFSIAITDNLDPVAAGQIVTYTISLESVGSSDLTDVQLTATLPANTTFVAFTGPEGYLLTFPSVGGTGEVTASSDHESGGNQRLFTLVVLVDLNTVAGTILNASGSVVSEAQDPDLTNNTDAESTTVQAAPASVADVAITAAVAPDPVNSGDELTYSLVVDNLGPDPADGILLSFAIPVGTTFVEATAPEGWTVTAPAVGGTGALTAAYRFSFLIEDGSGELRVVVRVADSTPGGVVIIGTATVAASSPDPEVNNNVATATVTVVGTDAPASDLSVALAGTPQSADVGQDVRYTIVVTNLAETAATRVVLNGQWPTGVTFVSASRGTFDPGTGTFTAGLGTIAGGATVTLTLVVRPKIAGSLISTVGVSGALTEPNMSNNQASVTTAVLASPTPNKAPTSAADSYATTLGVALTVPARGVLGNDTDPENRPLSAAVVTPPSHGAVSLNADGSFRYTPAAGFSGTDSFSYRASDGSLTSIPATVTLNVAGAPSTPVPVDTTGPRVTSLQRFGFHAQPTRLVLTFDQDLRTSGATDLANFRLVTAGRDGRFGTRDDMTIALRSATYDPASWAVSLMLRRPLPLRRQYQLSLRGSSGGLTDLADNGLDGGDSVVRFDRGALAGPSVIPRARSRFALAVPGGVSPRRSLRIFRL